MTSMARKSMQPVEVITLLKLAASLISS